MSEERSFSHLREAAFNFPAIDNHAHALLTPAKRSALPFEGLISEAEHDALTEDSIHTLACFRATAQLSKLFDLGGPSSWDAVKETREKIEYDQLCRMCFQPAGIQCILIDDGFGASDLAAEYRWHDRFTSSPTKRILRIEVVAQDILKELLDNTNTHAKNLVEIFTQKFVASLTRSASDAEVVGFKSIACYRTGLGISPTCSLEDIVECMEIILERYRQTNTLRLADKHFNDHVVRLALDIAGQCNKPVQFHTGLGDSDIQLSLSTPSLLQPLIKAYPKTAFVLLHSSYPFTREAGYLAAIYKNVFLDFGEVFPFVSGEGQRAVVRQVLELCPTNKILWSTDGHWWPESFYLGTIQAREALYDVLSENVRRCELTEQQAVGIVQNALFYNANRIYNLSLEPHAR